MDSCKYMGLMIAPVVGTSRTDRDGSIDPKNGTLHTHGRLLLTARLEQVEEW